MKFFIEIDFFEIAHAIAISNYIWETYVSKCEEFENEVNPESRKKIKDSFLGFAGDHVLLDYPHEPITTYDYNAGKLMTCSLLARFPEYDREIKLDAFGGFIEYKFDHEIVRFVKKENLTREFLSPEYSYENMKLLIEGNLDKMPEGDICRKGSYM